MNFIRSLYCWLKYKGHVWEWRHMSVVRSSTGTCGQVMRCIKCGQETVGRVAAIGK